MKQAYGFAAGYLAAMAASGSYIYASDGTNILPGRNPAAFNSASPQQALAAPGRLAYRDAKTAILQAQMVCQGSTVKLFSSGTMPANPATPLVLPLPGTGRPAAGTAPVTVGRGFGVHIRFEDSLLNFKPGMWTVQIGFIRTTTTADTDTFVMSYYFNAFLRQPGTDIVALFINNNVGEASIVGQDYDLVNVSGNVAGAAGQVTPAVRLENTASGFLGGASSACIPNVSSVVVETLTETDLDIRDDAPSSDRRAVMRDHGFGGTMRDGNRPQLIRL